MQNLQVLNNIQNHVKLSSTEEAYFLSKISTQKVSKKELILRQGQICRKLFFLESGCLRAYNINDEGKESTIMFALSDWWITDMHAFLNQKAALLSIEALDSSNLIGLSFSALENLYKEIPKFEKIFRILFQKAYVREQLRVLDNISYTTEERYYRFMAKYPEVAEKVSQKQIASFLGVTPEFLSTVKRNARS